jgi:hypothetical protein
MMSFDSIADLLFTFHCRAKSLENLRLRLKLFSVLSQLINNKFDRITSVFLSIKYGLTIVLMDSY